VYLFFSLMFFEVVLNLLSCRINIFRTRILFGEIAEFELPLLRYLYFSFS
jgi:hypothetical protein